jgi:signal transduction histidine kinase
VSKSRLTVRRQLAASFVVVLSLFAINLGVHSWAAARRDSSVEALRQATERRAVVVSIERELDDRQREVSVAQHVALDESQIAELELRLERVANLTSRLGREVPAGDHRRVEAFHEALDPLLTSWHRFYSSLRSRHLRANRKAVQGGASAPYDLKVAVLDRLNAMRMAEERRTHVAIAELTRMSILTHRMGVAIFVVSIIAAIAVSAWLWQRIATSLARLREGTARLTAGDMAFRIRLERHDELGDLAQAFNLMAASLATALAEARDARDAAERANRAKSAFLANMTHEFRTPMTAILGYAGFIREDAAERGLATIGGDAASIERAGRHMLTLVNDLLDLARIESGRMTLSIEEFDLDCVVRTLASTLRPLIAEHSNRLEISMPDPPGTMTADPVKVRQTLFNLLGNAAKFTDSGVITLAVERSTAGSEERVRFTVSDTGIGIARDRLEGIFEEYEQADASVGRKYGGTGLGLAITRRFCRMMGGEIRVQSEVGHGTTFTVDLPAVVGLDMSREGATIVSLPAPPPDRDDVAPRAATA